MSYHREIDRDAVLEVQVYEPDTALPIDEENQALINLLQSWREEDATDNLQELERRDAEMNDLLANLQVSRLSLPGLAEKQYAD